ncbi:hypothetical protein VTL71DRAFT_1102 [Oculimacula yallundae]|uniref:Uncharacterized protein n=1 Tax=Oculimacula yallundae TaxID=86028 RepID=A0ABR4D494_9HELO
MTVPHQGGQDTTKSHYTTYTYSPSIPYPSSKSCHRLSLSCERPLRACEPSTSVVLQPTRLSITIDLDEVPRLLLSNPAAACNGESAQYNKIYRVTLFARGVDSIPTEFTTPPNPRNPDLQTAHSLLLPISIVLIGTNWHTEALLSF